jgi:hypothetical protein
MGKVHQMMTHLVIVTPHTDFTNEERRQFVEALQRAAAAIPAVRGVRIGRRVMHGAGYEPSAPAGARYLVAIEFDDLRGLQEYLVHPAHAELGQLFRSLKGACVLDYEVLDLASIDWASF